MTRHVLETGEIDELDEISGDEQYCYIWCSAHQKHEWHWIDRDLIGLTSEVVRVSR